MLRRSDSTDPIHERRYNTRHLSTTLVSVNRHGERVMGNLVNLSIGGALLHAEGMNPRKNSRLMVIFIIRLNNGRLLKLHFRDATVIHVTAGNIGVTLGQRNERLIK